MSRLSEFSLPLSRPLRTARGTIGSRDGLLVRAGGGTGEATPLPGWTEPLAACRRALEDGIGSIDAAGNALGALGELDALDGAPAARHGLSLALLDGAARRAGDPLYRHLGGGERVEAVPVNATVGDGPAGETAREARAAVESGFGSLKVKVGARPVGEDVERLAAVREAAPDAELRADANAAWTREEARRALSTLAGLDVSYVEQPLARDDLEGHAALRGRGVGVALDETLSAHSPGDALDAGAADVLILKPMVLGGVDRAREAAERAIEAGVEATVTTTVDAVVARTAAVHLAASLPDPPACGLATAGRLGADLAPDPAPVEGGTVRVPEEKGHGVAVEWGE